VEGTPDFDVRVEREDDGRTWVQVCGELDLATAGELEAALAGEDAGGKTVIDLSGCGFLDSSGLRVLLAEVTRAESEGGTVALVAPERLRRVLELAGVDVRVPIHATRDAAR
jgi:anti-anti-sigma factor